MAKKKTWLTPNEAIEILRKNKIKTTRTTFLGCKKKEKVGWVEAHSLGHKVGGRWNIFPERIEKFLKHNFHIGKIYAKKK